MIEKIDHIGIAVRSLSEAVERYERSLGLACLRREEVVSERVRIAFFEVGESLLELIEPMSADSSISKFLEKHGEGIHHIALRTDHLEGQLSQAAGAGCRLIQEAPVEGAGGQEVAFVHPKSLHGVLLEFCAAKAAKRAGP